MSHLEKMPEADRTRWRQFLSYILAARCIMHDTRKNSRGCAVVDHSVQKDSHRREYRNMGRTIAEMYIDQGRLEGEIKAQRKTLLRQLRKRFKKLPRKVEARINAATNMHDLETWLDNIVEARSLADVGIPMD